MAGSPNVLNTQVVWACSIFWFLFLFKKYVRNQNKDSISTQIDKQNQKTIWPWSCFLSRCTPIESSEPKTSSEWWVTGAVSAQRSDQTRQQHSSCHSWQLRMDCGFINVQILARGNSGATGMESKTQYIGCYTIRGLCVCVCVNCSTLGMCKSVCLFVRKLFIKMLFVHAWCSGELVLFGLGQSAEAYS